ncbi:MAG TPA: YfhO family protein, partial [Pirellulales bacterium]|nr:YfhO family protein [Pirellulales bacterium]
TVRDKAFLGVSFGFLALFGLSLGGAFARGVYHLPGMPIFRHVGLVFGIGSMLLLVAGGFGIDRAISRLRGRTVAMRPVMSWRLAWLALIAALLLADAWFCRRPYELEPRFVHPGAWPFAIFRGALYGAALAVLAIMYVSRWRPARFKAGVAAMISVIVLLDMGSFRAEVFATIQRVPQSMRPPEIFAASALLYTPDRGSPPPDRVCAARLKLFNRPIAHTNNSHYLTLCPMAGIDPCPPPYRGDFLCPGTCELIRARGGNPTARPTDAYLPAGDEALRKVLACQQPKLRLTRRVQIVRTEAEAKSLLVTTPDIFAVTTLISSEAPASESPADAAAGPAIGSVAVVDFGSNRIRLRAVVEGSQPAWLIYADAWHPGWQARIDGKSTPISRANLAFKAVPIAPGEHAVEFVYAPAWRNALAWCVALIGLAAGSALVIGMLVSTLAELRRHRPARAIRVPAVPLVDSERHLPELAALGRRDN